MKFTEKLRNNVRCLEVEHPELGVVYVPYSAWTILEISSGLFGTLFNMYCIEHFEAYINGVVKTVNDVSKNMLIEYYLLYFLDMEGDIQDDLYKRKGLAKILGNGITSQDIEKMYHSLLKSMYTEDLKKIEEVI